MITFVDWLPPATFGLMFTILGSLKLWGLTQGIVGGADKPVVQRIYGTCPTWENRSFPLLLLGLGLFNLGWLGWVLFSDR